MKVRFVLVDVFADRPLAGNPLVVFPEAAGLDDETLQLLAREVDHAASAFLLPTSLPGADFRLRIFTREREIPWAFDTVGSVEIPGAGAAAGALAAYLVTHSAVAVEPVTALTIEQGHCVNRPSTLFTEVHLVGDEIVKVVLGGRVVRVGEGHLEF